MQTVCQAIPRAIGREERNKTNVNLEYILGQFLELDGKDNSEEPFLRKLFGRT